MQEAQHEAKYDWDGQNAQLTHSSEDEEITYKSSNSIPEQTHSIHIKDVIGLSKPISGDFETERILYTVEKTAEHGNQYEYLRCIRMKNFPEHLLKSLDLVNESDAIEDRLIDASVHVLVSTGSGDGTAKRLYNNLIESLLSHLQSRLSFEWDVVMTESASTISEYARRQITHRANNGKKQMMLLLSGDGGISDIINILAIEDQSPVYRNPALALLPIGTANALAHSLGITKDNTYGLSAWFRGRANPLPMFSVEFSAGSRLITNEGTSEQYLPQDSKGSLMLYGCVVCSWGLHASLVADSDTKEYRKLGSARFAKAANELLHPQDGKGPHQYKGKLSLLKANDSGETFWNVLQHNEHAYVLATMVSKLERTFTISPASKPFEEKLRLVHIKPKSGEDIMNIMQLAYDNGKHVQDPDVTYEEVEGLRIEFDDREPEARWRRVCVDGKIVLVEENGWIEVRKSSKSVVDVVSFCKEPRK